MRSNLLYFTKTLKEQSWARNLMSRCFIGKHPSWNEIYSSALPPKDVILSLLWNSWQVAVGMHWVSTRIATNTWEFSPFACLLLQICLHLPEHRFTNFACTNPHFLFGALAGNLEAFSEDIRSLLVAWLVQTLSLHWNYHPWGLPPTSSSKAHGIHSPFYTEY